jgi:ABC-type oligopeptide transport system ATPase subunit
MVLLQKIIKKIEKKFAEERASQKLFSNPMHIATRNFYQKSFFYNTQNASQSDD